MKVIDVENTFDENDNISSITLYLDNGQINILIDDKPNIFYEDYFVIISNIKDIIKKNYIDFKIENNVKINDTLVDVIKLNVDNGQHIIHRIILSSNKTIVDFHP